MTILKRKKIFETNSSSTHSLVIPKKVENKKYSLDDSLEHDYYFGRQESRLVDTWDEKLAYVYMLLKTNYEWSHSNNTWKPSISTSKKELNEFKKKVWEIWKEVVHLVISNDTKYDIETEKHIPLTQEEIEEEKKEYLDTKSNNYRKPNPKDIFKYIDREGKDGNLTGDDSCYIIMERYGCYVDHANDIDIKFIERIKNDNEFLKRLLFNKQSYITVGGDEFRGYNIKTIGFEYDYESSCLDMNEKGEFPPQEWLTEYGTIKDEYWDKYREEYTLEAGEFWNKLREYEKENDVYLKGN